MTQFKLMPIAQLNRINELNTKLKDAREVSKSEITELQGTYDELVSRDICNRSWMRDAGILFVMGIVLGLSLFGSGVELRRVFFAVSGFSAVTVPIALPEPHLIGHRRGELDVASSQHVLTLEKINRYLARLNELDPSDPASEKVLTEIERLFMTGSISVSF